MSVVVITGCSSGIGLACARRFVDAGWQVVATARRPEAAPELMALGERAGVRVDALDVTAPDQFDTLQRIVDEVGSIDVLVNNAGISAIGAVEDTSLDAVRTILETNVLGPLRLMQAVLPGMRARGTGTIVNVGSIYGLVAAPFVGAYSASKHALASLTTALRYEVARYGVRVALVEPGNFRTRIADNATVMSPPGSPYAGGVLTAQGLRDTLASAAPEVTEVADAVFDVATAAQPPLHTVLGSDAHLLLDTARRDEAELEQLLVSFC